MLLLELLLVARGFLLAWSRSGGTAEAFSGGTGRLAAPARGCPAITAIVAFLPEPARRMTGETRFDRLFAEGAHALLSGTQQRQAAPAEDGPR